MARVAIVQEGERLSKGHNLRYLTRQFIERHPLAKENIVALMKPQGVS